LQECNLGIITESANGNQTLILTGECDVYSAPLLKHKLIDAIQDASVESIVVDLRALLYLDATGMGVLIGGLKRMRESGRDLTLCCTGNRQVERKFDITGLDKIFKMVDDTP
jgi:anti-sigma B factor antagonist